MTGYARYHTLLSPTRECLTILNSCLVNLVGRDSEELKVRKKFQIGSHKGQGAQWRLKYENAMWEERSCDATP